MDFYAKTGPMALGSRLRRLSERLAYQAAEIYKLYGNDLQPRWFPVFYILSEGEARSISDIADQIGHSHASVSQIVSEMEARGYVKEKKGGDGRKRFVQLTTKAKALDTNLKYQYADVGQAVETAMVETTYNLWKAIGEWEQLLDEKDMKSRVMEARNAREATRVRIVDYNPEHQTAFKDLNKRWITQYFKMEGLDFETLEHPQEYILDKGGHILIALLDDQPVGTVALIPEHDESAEAAKSMHLAKMAVAPEAQGRHIGWMLGVAAIERARQLKATKITLGSNTVLKAAVNLYYKLGFQKVTGPPSPYERCNIQMEMWVK
jgi:DNA-binding MarR family transcriptional regulator/N-acetylglutamate synthase-like GNAT family acetyltransferase